MKYLAALLFVLCSPALAQQYTCSPEQLKERYKPIVPSKPGDGPVTWNIYGFVNTDPQAAIRAYLSSKGNGLGAVCGCMYVTNSRGETVGYACHPVIHDGVCYTDQWLTASKQVPASTCPPSYQMNGGKCESPALISEDQLDGAYSAVRSRNPDGTTRDLTDQFSNQWTTEAFDAQGRTTVIRNPDQSTTTLTWSGVNIATRDTDGYLTKYHSWVKGKPTAVETQGVAYAVLGWDKDRTTINRMESIGTGGILLGLDSVRAPLRTVPAAVSLAAAAAPATLFYVVDFAATPAPPLIAVGAAAAGGIVLGSYIYPIIEPALTRVIDACAQSLSPAQQAVDKCNAAADRKAERAIGECRKAHDKARNELPLNAPNADWQRIVAAYEACIKNAQTTWIAELKACIQLIHQ